MLQGEKKKHFAHTILPHLSGQCHILKEGSDPKSRKGASRLNDMTRNYYGQRGTNRNAAVQQFAGAAQPGLSALPSDAAVAMAYVPMQTDATVYDADKALQAGTLFPVLNKPFAGAGDRR